MQKVRLENSQIPLHFQIADYIMDMLRRGDLNPNEKLPPEENLKVIFDVSRTTVRHSLDHLMNKGLLKRKQGKGTFWTPAAHVIKSEKLAGLNRQIFNISEKTRVNEVSKSIEKGNREIIDFFKGRAGPDFTVFRRTRFINDEPMSYTINYLPRPSGRLIRKDHLRRMTMLEVLEKVLHIDLGTIEHEVEITRANNDISQRLRIAVLDPVLTVKTSVFDKDKNPVEVVWTYFIENKYKFRVVLD